MEGTTISAHLNEFNTIFSQLTAQEIVFSDPLKAMFYSSLCQTNWNTFTIALNNYVSPNGLTSSNVEDSLLVGEVNRTNIDKGKGEALVVHVRHGSQRKKGKRSQSQSTSYNARDK